MIPRPAFTSVSAWRGGRRPTRSTARTASPDLVRAREMFGKTIQLRPGFAEAYVEHARILNEWGGDPGAAIPLLEAARPLLPSRIDIVMNLAALYARKGDGARGRDLVENVLARMNDREAVETARNLVRIEEGHRAALQPSVAPL